VAASTSANKRILGKKSTNQQEVGPANSPVDQPPKHAEDTTSTPEPPVCPECGSTKLYRDGLRYPRSNEGPPIQRLLCRSCGFRFSESTLQRQEEVNILGKPGETPHSRSDVFKAEVHEGNLSGDKLAYEPSLVFGEDVGSHGVTVVGKSINSFRRYNSNCRVRVLEGEAKNLAQVEPQTEKAGAGATLDVKGKIVEYVWYMKKQAYAKTTILGRTQLLKTMIKRGARLQDPEAVKEFIAKQETWGDGRKANAVDAYSTFLAMEGLTWTPPRYKRPEGLPFIPLESEIDQFIAASGKVVGTFLQGLKETAADPGELWAIRWTDINPKARTVTINHPVKGHNPRILTISPELIARLNMLPKTSERVFPCLMKNMYRNFWLQRARIAKELSNPRLMEIVFTTLRHWKATMLYHQMKDILYVMKFLGHKTLKSTLIYIDLERALYGSGDDEFTVKVAESLDEACKLLEVGFDYVTDMEGRKIFRKRK